jgi:beta-lactamase class A
MKLTLAMLWLAAIAADVGTTGNASVVAPVPSTASGKSQVLWDHLRHTLAGVEQRLDGVLGVAILDLTSGEQLLVNADEVFPQASSIKITVLAELYRQSQHAAQGQPTVARPGSARLDDGYVVRKEDLVADSDIMGGLTPGVTRLTNRDLATMMIAVSDNAATNVLIDRVGMDNVNRMLTSQGLTHTQLRRKMMDLKAAGEGRENVSTPREMMTLLERLYRGQVIAAPLLEDFWTMLATHKSSWVPRGLPAELRIADKPGELEGVRADSGVVFLPHRPYVICVMTTFLTNERDGEEAISAISAATYGMFDRLARASEYGRVISPGNGSVR